MEFYFIKLPDYITSTDPIDIQAFSLPEMDESCEIINDPSGVPIEADQMTPGRFDLIAFTPSNFFAFATQVKYSIEVRPQHDLYPDSRLVIKMPPTL